MDTCISVHCERINDLLFLCTFVSFVLLRSSGINMIALLVKVGGGGWCNKSAIHSQSSLEDGLVIVCSNPSTHSSREQAEFWLVGLQSILLYNICHLAVTNLKEA